MFYQWTTDAYTYTVRSLSTTKQQHGHVGTGRNLIRRKLGDDYVADIARQFTQRLEHTIQGRIKTQARA